MIKMDILNPQNQLSNVSFPQKVLGNLAKVEFGINSKILRENQFKIN